MTREEAHRILSNGLANASSEHEWCIAFKMAIKALEQESCEDCISRQVVLDKIKEVCFSKEQKWIDFRVSNGAHGQRDLIINFIESLPSVTPKQKIGCWEYVQYDYNPFIGNWHCSECRNIVIECADNNKDGGIPTYSYCPNCGAKMAEPFELQGSEEK